MSHLTINQLIKSIKFIRKYSKIPICIDTEGAQIRIKFNKVKLIKLKKKERLGINKQNGKFNFYPTEVFNLLKKNDILNVGFEGLQLKILNKNKNTINLICTKPGTFENWGDGEVAELGERLIFKEDGTLEKHSCILYKGKQRSEAEWYKENEDYTSWKLVGDEIHVKPVKDLGESYVDTLIYKIQKDDNLNFIGTHKEEKKYVSFRKGS